MLIKGCSRKLHNYVRLIKTIVSYFIGFRIMQHFIHANALLTVNDFKALENICTVLA